MVWLHFHVVLYPSEFGTFASKTIFVTFLLASTVPCAPSLLLKIGMTLTTNTRHKIICSTKDPNQLYNWTMLYLAFLKSQKVHIVILFISICRGFFLYYKSFDKKKFQSQAVHYNNILILRSDCCSGWCRVQNFFKQPREQFRTERLFSLVTK